MPNAPLVFVFAAVLLAREMPSRYSSSRRGRHVATSVCHAVSLVIETLEVMVTVPVLLSWREVQEQCIAADSGRNVVIHEFAHLLDMQNYEIDGIPALAHHIDAEQWVATFQDEFERLIRQARHRRKTVLDYYGTTSEAEFFAVASEAFFERAAQLREESPELYAILQEFYRQDPAARA